jgi:diketogulonate reductase-like aldo/keto reductase
MVMVITLANGVEIPVLGFGTFRIEGDLCRQAVLTALETGYRHIDTAKAYGNEVFVGRAIKESGLERKEIFITTKLVDSNQGYENTLRAFDESLEKLGLDYLDLYLIHWPTEKSGESWKALEKLYKEKRVRAIGLSNFYPQHLEKLIRNPEITPQVNQLERHPFFTQAAYKGYLERQGIKLEAYAPLAQGSTAFVPHEAGTLLENPVLRKIAERHHRTTAQIALRWNIQSGVIVIPKSANPARIKENFDIFDFVLSDEDIQRISALDEGGRVSWYPENFSLA